eukprot:jgi/Botrbrau1/526/Bobra.0010s0001.1
MGAAVSCVANNGGRQLLIAAASGDPGIVREVLELRPQLATCALINGGNSVTHQAAYHGHLEVLKAIVDSLQSCGREVEGDSDLKGRALINWARFTKEVVNCRNASGQTPLMLASLMGHAACVRFLLDNFADPFALDKATRRNALIYAAAAGRTEVVKRLLDEGCKVMTEEGPVPLRNAIVHDELGNARYVDSRGENGLTALHVAALGGHLGTVLALLAAGANLMVCSVDMEMHSAIRVPAGSTPLHLAAMNGSIAIVQAILQVRPPYTTIPPADVSNKRENFYRKSRKL